MSNRLFDPERTGGYDRAVNLLWSVVLYTPLVETSDGHVCVWCGKWEGAHKQDCLLERISGFLAEHEDEANGDQTE